LRRADTTTTTPRGCLERQHEEAIDVNAKRLLISMAALAWLGLVPAQEAAPPPELSENAMVRFVHLSPNAEAAEVSLRSTEENGVSLAPEELARLAYTSVSDFVSVPAGEYAVVVGAAVAVDDVDDAEDRAEPAAAFVDVRLRDGSIEMDGEIPAGLVTFEVTNAGSVAHGFAIEGVVEGTNGPLEAGESATVTLTLEPGTYRAYCPVGDHAAQGMEFEFTVTEPTEVEEADAAERPAELGVRRASDLATPALEEIVTFRANRSYTVAIIGLVLPGEALDGAEEGGFFAWLRGLFAGDDPADRDVLALRFEVIEEDLDAFVAPDAARIRVVHAAPGSAHLDVAVAGERGTLVRDLDFGDLSRYVTLQAADTTLEVRPTGSRAVALDLSGIDLGLGMIHTIFITGTPIEEVPLEAVVLSDTPTAPPLADPIEPMVPAPPAQPADSVDPGEPDEPDAPDEDDGAVEDDEGDEQVADDDGP
jgi:uncharacterized cupredoxin-like copper-binding protein